uniref:VASt domain-containing protein n=1 Tax=Ananas comosus var. bracteatus TaxID=296719 RepID=A0A6V7PZV9_ANACO|nr:unnamed protein product [Ananas comosus var. bracteatus]
MGWQILVDGCVKEDCGWEFVDDINVYGPTTAALRADFFHEIRAIADLSTGAWTVLGNFNVLLSVQDKNGPSVNVTDILNFREVVHELGLVDLPYLINPLLGLMAGMPRLWSVWIALLSPIPGYLLFLDPPSEPSRDLGLTTRPLYFLPIPSFLMPICSDLRATGCAILLYSMCFYNDTAKIDMINTSWLCLISKKKEALFANDFRPISLVHSMAKLISKGKFFSLYRCTEEAIKILLLIPQFQVFAVETNTRPVDEITPLSVTEGAKHSRMTSINNSICAGEDLDIVPGSHLAEGITNNDSVNKSATLAVDKDASAEFTDATFEEAMEIMQLRDEGEMPENLRGGTLLEQTYIIEPKDLNSLLFGPNSKFMKDLAELQGTTDYQETPWTWKCMDPPCLTRAVSYTKAATKLVKAVKATEEQTYVKADGKRFAVMVRVSTPEVPFGNSFEVVLLYKIMPGPELLSGEESSHFVISFNTLSQHIKPATSSELEFDKDKLLAPLQLDHQSDLELAIKYFCNFTVVSTIVMVLYVLLHILLSQPATMKGLEFDGLDLPDTFGEDAKRYGFTFLSERVF